jgi:hypothetical protein
MSAKSSLADWLLLAIRHLTTNGRKVVDSRLLRAGHKRFGYAAVRTNMEDQLNVCNSVGNRDYIKATPWGLTDLFKLEAVLRSFERVGGPTPLYFAKNFVTHTFPGDPW